eukprot:6374659-Amphidinium_carterae.1
MIRDHPGVVASLQLIQPYFSTCRSRNVGPDLFQARESISPCPLSNLLTTSSKPFIMLSRLTGVHQLNANHISVTIQNKFESVEYCVAPEALPASSTSRCDRGMFQRKHCPVA